MRRVVAKSPSLISLLGTLAFGLVLFHPANLHAEPTGNENKKVDQAAAPAAAAGKPTDHRIEPSDVLHIEAIKLLLNRPYRLEPLDIIWIRGQQLYPDHPLDGQYQVEASGIIDLGEPYGSFRVAGLTVDQAAGLLLKSLKKDLVDPSISVKLIKATGVPPIGGDYSVAADGTVNLKKYGTVRVAGLTVSQAKVAIERQLSFILLTPEVTVQVKSFASRAYYVIVEGEDSKDRITKHVVTGKETVLDALSDTRAYPRLAQMKITLVRPSPGAGGASKVLPVDWKAITEGTSMATNHRILPGDLLRIAPSK